MTRRKVTTGPWTGIPLQRARKRAGLSQSELARRVAREPGCESVSPTTVQCNEPGPRGGRSPNATLLGAYARVLGVTTDSLLAVEPIPYCEIPAGDEFQDGGRCAGLDTPLPERDPDPTIEVPREALGLPPRS